MKRIILFFVVMTAMVCSISAQNADLQKWTKGAMNRSNGIHQIENPKSVGKLNEYCSLMEKSTKFQCGALTFAGIGTGLSIYEKALIPLFADAKFLIIKPRKFTPYIKCGVGYSFAPDKNANGGFYLNPSAGVEYSIYKSKKLFLALGYESQKLEQLKTQKQSLFTAEFAEKLIHNAISIKIGFIF